MSDKRYGESLRLVMDIFDAEKSKSVPFADRPRQRKPWGKRAIHG